MVKKIRRQWKFRRQRSSLLRMDSRKIRRVWKLLRKRISLLRMDSRKRILARNKYSFLGRKLLAGTLLSAATATKLKIWENTSKPRQVSFLAYYWRQDSWIRRRSWPPNNLPQKTGELQHLKQLWTSGSQTNQKEFSACSRPRTWKRTWLCKWTPHLRFHSVRNPSRREFFPVGRSVWPRSIRISEFNREHRVWITKGPLQVAFQVASSRLIPAPSCIHFERIPNAGNISRQWQAHPTRPLEIV